ncbi:hypothetical protein MED297_05664 [Reinekea sp. MED297]|uniref:Uncharacterized protein n=2 Tax=Reinekea TaxID=230494 RepID=A4BD67_9GAMM|nr:hypothetical protein MED297_05664 [Reinekea sp. MED297] [Reinekea blandensis MED297]
MLSLSPPDSAVDTERKLYQLVLGYSQSLPSVMEAFDQGCQQYQWHQVGENALFIIAQYFQNDSTTSTVKGLLSVQDSVFFGHRLIEELHDHLMCHCGHPVLPWNMTKTNLLMHQFIGQSFAAQLEVTAMELTEKLMKQTPDDVTTDKPSHQEAPWPCFFEQYDLNVSAWPTSGSHAMFNPGR